MEENEPISDEAKALLREEQARLVKLIEALVKLDKSEEWNTLKELVYDKSLLAIERQLLQEALSKDIKTEKLYHLQGQWAWAKQFCDVNRFVVTLKQQLEEIKKRIK